MAWFWIVSDCTLSGKCVIVSNWQVWWVTWLGAGPLTSFDIKNGAEKLIINVSVSWIGISLWTFSTFNCLHLSDLWVSYSTGLTCIILKLSATEVAMSLLGIVSNFSFSVTFKFCFAPGSYIADYELLMMIRMRTDDLSKAQSQYTSEDICLLVCCLCSFPFPPLCIASFHLVCHLCGLQNFCLVTLAGVEWQICQKW